MRPVIRSFWSLPLLLLAMGLIAIACGPTEEDGFSRGGHDGHSGGHDDDDDAHGAEEDRWAYVDLVRTAAFNSDAVEITAKVSVFEEATPRWWPQPGGLDDCILGEEGDDPHFPPRSTTGRGNPVMILDGEDWELELSPETEVFQRVLPERTWIPFDDVTVSVPGGEEPSNQWDDVLSIPETLEGVSAVLTEDGMELEWEGGVPENQLRLIVSSKSGGQYVYVVCLPGDDGAFTVPAEAFLEELEGWDITAELRRETIRDEFGLSEFQRGTAVGISALHAVFAFVVG